MHTVDSLHSYLYVNDFLHQHLSICIFLPVAVCHLIPPPPPHVFLPSIMQTLQHQILLHRINS